MYIAINTSSEFGFVGLWSTIIVRRVLTCVRTCMGAWVGWGRSYKNNMHERRLQRAHGHAHARDNNIPSQNIPKSHQFIQMWAGKQDDLTTCKFVGGMRGGPNYMLLRYANVVNEKSQREAKE